MNGKMGKYEGMIQNGIPSGQGIFVDIKKHEYKGTFIDGWLWNGTFYNPRDNIRLLMKNGKLKWK